MGKKGYNGAPSAPKKRNESLSLDDLAKMYNVEPPKVKPIDDLDVVENEGSGNKFINPYCFVELGSGKKLADKKDRNLTGYLDYTLSVQNKIILPGDILKDSDSKEYDYFHYPNSKDPVITGSQIRGTVRGIYEALTDSCLGAINEDGVDDLSKRVKMQELREFKKMVLVYSATNNSWYLCKANSINYKNKKNTRVNEDVYSFTDGGTTYVAFDDLIIDKNSITGNNNLKKFSKIIGYNEKPNYTVGTHSILYIGNEKVVEDGKSLKESAIKQHAIVVFQYTFSTEKKVDDETIKNFKDVLKSFTPATAYKRYLDGLNDKIALPVYVKTSNNHTYISPANMGRIMPYKELSDLYKGYNQCESKEDACPACSLFGFIGKENITSRVRFLDATLTSNSSFNANEHKTLCSMGPHISNTQFYMTGDDIDGGKTRIKGRKFYWHNQNCKIIECTPDNSKDNDKVKTNHVVLSKANGKFDFTGRIYFNNLNKNELDKLLFAVSLGNDENHMHKLGHAKPYGFGSVKAHIDNLYLRAINKETLKIESNNVDINKYMTSNWSSLTNDNRSITQLDYVLNYNTIKNVDIAYPYINTNGNIFDWFAENTNTNISTQKLNYPSSELSTVVLYTKHYKTYKK